MRHRYCGFYTVEMCVIFPIVFMVILSLISLTFYYYDMSLVHSRVYELLRYGEKKLVYGIDIQAYDSIEEGRELLEIKEYAQEVLTEGLYVTKISIHNGSLTDGVVLFEGTCEVTLPGLALIKRWNPSAFCIPFELRETCICREERTRAISLIKEITRKGDNK